MSLDLNFASLFSGCGGFDLGFISAGFNPVAAFDIDRNAIGNFRRNVHSHAYAEDLTIANGVTDHLANIDVLVAGPPCQGFSTAGKREINDHRNHLLILAGKLSACIRPKVVVIENVGGAIAGEHARYWQSMVETLRAAGYRTHVLSCQAAQLGMAQIRKRIILIAWRTGREARFPLPQCLPSTLRTVLNGVESSTNHEPRTLMKGTADWLIACKIKQGQKLCNVRAGANSIATWDIPKVFGAITQDERTILELLRQLRRQERRRDFGDADPVSVGRLEKALGRPFKKLLNSLITKGYVRRADDHYDLVGTFNGKYRRLSWNAVSCTVDTRFGSPRYFLHPERAGGFTVREAARIQGFPDSYFFEGTHAAQYRLIGNAVPPPMGSLAASYASYLLGKS